jgi:hypothetical protein
MTLTNPETFITLGLHGIAAEPKRQPPKISAAEALAELAIDCRTATVRALMDPS